MARSPVDFVNEVIPITFVLSKMGVDVPDYSSGTSWKTNCPFENVYHLDKGGSKSLRVYFASNSAYCFRGCGYLTPVTLYSLKTGLSKSEAATMLLHANGVELPSLGDQLEDTLRIKTTISKSSLREALQIFCRREVGNSWSIDQFQDSVIEALDNCLKLLDRVENEDTAKEWLEKSKQYMKVVLKGI